VNSLLTMRAICDEPVPSPARLVPGYPAPLARICLRALERDREARYGSAAELRRELVAAERKMGGSEPPDEALAALLATLFEERIAEKRELLGRLGAGAEVDTVPAGEVDIEVELPTVLEKSAERTSTTPFAVEGKERSASLPRVFAGMAVGGLVVGIAAAFFFGRPAPDTPDTVGPGAAPARVAPVAPPPVPESAAARLSPPAPPPVPESAAPPLSPEPPVAPPEGVAEPRGEVAADPAPRGEVAGEPAPPEPPAAEAAGRQSGAIDVERPRAPDVERSDAIDVERPRAPDRPEEEDEEERPRRRGRTERVEPAPAMESMEAPPPESPFRRFE
jgi:hypothetical protein